MKKILLLFFAAIIPAYSFVPDCEPNQMFACNILCHEYIAQSFMFTRPVYRNLAAQTSNWWHDIVAEKPFCFGGAVQAIAEFQRSIKHCGNARYFLFDHKNTLVVKGDSAPSPAQRDVRAEWLNLSSGFNGEFTITPKQQQFGFWLEYNQDLKTFTDFCLLQSMWIDIAMPIQVIENNLNLEQNIVTASTTPGIETIAQAFMQPTWEFGKIGPKRKKHGIGELIFKLGITFLKRDGFEITAYNNFWFPLGKIQNPEFVFDPFVGHNGHYGFGQGVTFQFPLHCNTDCQLFAVFLNIDNLYLVRNFQKRSFDIRGKPWSRYLLLNKDDGISNIPAINILTAKAKVRPFNFVDLTTGFRYHNEFIEAEIGYGLWAHGDERITLDCDFEEHYGIAGTAPFTTANESTIGFRAPNDAIFRIILAQDLDLESAAARAAFTSKIYGTAAFNLQICNFATIVGIGGFAEFPNRNAALKNWGIWAKFAATF